MSKEVLIRTQDLSKTFGATKAVKQVSFEVYKGEIHGLIGENGSGKSTITNMITGIHTVTSGEMFLEGQKYEPKNQLDANRHGVSIIVQEMNTIEDLTVAENIFFGNEELFIRNGVIDSKAMNKKAREYLDVFGFDKINPADDVAHYTFEERKMIELVKATYFNPKLLVVDETTTALSHDGREKLYELIRRVKNSGGSVIVISHDLQEVLELCDSITVLRDGEHIKSFPVTDEVTEDDLKKYMVGRELSGKYYREDTHSNITGEVVMSLKDVNVEGMLSNINLELHKGEILGIGGLTESGMHELGKVMFGALEKQTGTVSLPQKNVEIGSIKTAIASGVAYASKNRDQEGLMINASILDNVCLSSMDKLQRKGFISPKRERGFTNEYATKMNVKMENINQFVSALSGGNKQKVVLAKWLGRDSDILVLDSPTRGIDVMVKASIYELMQELTRQGKSIVMISEEILELIGMCDRLVVLKDGEITGELLREEGLSEEKIIHYMI